MFLDDFAHGALTTIELTVYSGLLGFAIALVAGTAMLSRFRVLRFVARTYTEVFRGASELVILYVFVFGIPQWTPLDLPTFGAAVVALALNIGGYEAEVVRGAVQAVPRGQTEAAIALNMPPLLRLRRIIVPQALVSMLPPINVLTVQLLKASALVSIIGLTDLTSASEHAVRLTLNNVRFYGEALIAYYIIATVINQLFRVTERALRRGRDIGGARRAPTPPPPPPSIGV
ncbi:MAG: amino acid ABC transporter permease [Nocardioidaceae bacterium]